MIDYDRLKTVLPDAQAQWQKADPFPYCSFDGMLEPDLALQMAEDFPEAVARSGKDTHLQKHLDVNRKVGIPKLDWMSETQRQFFAAVNAPRFLAYLEELTGIAPLYADPDLFGGGLHAIYAGGFLNVHADFNFHPKTHKWRCLNLITYLTPDWQPSWNGQLELWSEHLDKDPVLIDPVLNRTAIFRTNETSWHGHPRPLACPEDASRRSVAVYYYTDWPDALEQRSATHYVLTPWQRADLTAILQEAWDQIGSEADAIRIAARFQKRHVADVYAELQACQQ